MTEVRHEQNVLSAMGSGRTNFRRQVEANTAEDSGDISTIFWLEGVLSSHL